MNKHPLPHIIWEIFPKPSPYILWAVIIYVCDLAIAFAIAIAITSCSSMHHVPTVPIETIRSDTLYLSNTQYDSIYILQDKYVDRTRDTLYIRDSSIEYRYRMLRDTIRLVQCDSIPYEVTITEIKQVTRPPTSFDHLTRLTFWIVIGFLLCSIGFKLKSFFKR